VLQIRGILAKRKDLIARNQETSAPALDVRIRWLRIIAGTMSLVDKSDNAFHVDILPKTGVF
jgi:hypothetical protein